LLDLIKRNDAQETGEIGMKVSPLRILELERAERKLEALEAGGVDNWEGYSDSLHEYAAEEMINEEAGALLDVICELLCQGVYEPSESGAGVAFRPEDEVLALAEIVKFVATIDAERK
jgi:hypothetical protein